MSELEQGDIIEADFNPSVGYEPAKRRPAIVVSGYGFNSRSSLVSVVPITTKDSGYPLHVPCGSKGVSGFACVEQLRNIDVVQRGYSVIGSADEGSMKAVMSTIRGMLELR